MTENMDPRIDKLVAYLYGELPESEARAFRRLLETDDALRAEYEELSGAREVLGGWEVEERVPSFVLVEGTEPRRERRAAPASARWWERLTESLRSFAVTPAWGLAAAAALLLIAGAFGFRVERVDGGLAFRFGGDRPAATQPAGRPVSPGGAELASNGPDAMPDSGGANRSPVVPVSADGYLTRDDLKSYDADLMLTLAQLLNEYSRKRDQEVAEGFQSLYQQVTTERLYNDEQLAGRIDVIGRELLLETDRSARGFREVLQNQNDDKQPLKTED